MIAGRKYAGQALSYIALSFLLALCPADAKGGKSTGPALDDPGCKNCMSQAANLFASNQIKQALQLLASWTAKCPRNAQLHLLYSTILVREGKDFAGAEREAQLAVAARPDSQAAHLQFGMTLISNQKYQQAASEFKAVTELNPASFEAWSALADLYKRLHEDELASQAAQRAAGLEPGTRTVRLAVLTNLKRSGNFVRAKKELQRLLKEGGFGPEFDEALAEEGLQIGAYDEALEGSTRSSQAYPKSLQPLKIAALAQFLSYQFQAAIDSSEKMLAVAPGNADALALKALALFALNKAEPAMQAAALAEQADASGLSLVAAGQARLHAGEYAKAIDSWNSCASTGPRMSAAERLPETLAHINLFRLYHSQGAGEEAIREARSIGADPRFKSASLGAQAVCLFDESSKPEQVAQANKLLKDVSELTPASPELLLAKAAAGLQSGNIEQCQQLAEKAATLEPGFAEATVFLARAGEAKGAWPESLLQAALGSAPKDPGLLCMKSKLLLKADKFDDAIQLLTPLVQEPAAPTAELLLAQAYEKKGDKQEALKYYKQSLEGLSGDSAQVARSAVKRLEGKS